MTQPPARRRLANSAWSIAKVVLALALIGYIASRTGLSDIAALRHRLSFPWLAASLVLFAILNAVRAYQYYVLTGRQAPFGRVLNLVILQNTLSNFVASSAGALAYIAMLSAQERVSLRRAAASFVIAKLGDLVAVGLLLAVSATLVWQQIGALHQIVLLLLLSAAAITTLILLAAFLRGRIVSRIERAMQWLGLKRWAFSTRALEMLQSFAVEKPGEMRSLLSAGLAYSIVAMLLNLGWLYASLRTFSLQMPAAGVALINALLQLISWIPIQVFGGLGVVEAALTYLATFFAIEPSVMAPVSIGIRAVLCAASALLLAYPLLTELRARAARG